MSAQDDRYLAEKQAQMNETIEELHRRNGAIDVDPEAPENQTEVEDEAVPEPVEGQDAATDSEPATAEDETEEGDSPKTLSNAALLKQIADMKAEFELEKDRNRLEAEKWKFLASREAGKRGFEKQTKQQDRVPADLADFANSISEDKDSETVKTDEEEWRQEQRNSVVYNEMGRLTEETPNFLEIMPLVEKHILAKRADFASAIENGSPSTARKATRMLYQDALNAAQAEKLAADRAAGQSRKLETATKVLAKKQASTPPKSAPSNAGVKKAGPKGGAEPTQEELIAEFARRRAAGTYLE
jgi:hypothetical protein